MSSPEGSAGGDLAPGRHDAVVVDARWRTGEDPPVLELSLTLLGGANKGEVVDVAFIRGTPALGRALSSLGVAAPEAVGADADDAVTAGALGMPCTLVLARDDEGRLGYALDP